MDWTPFRLSLQVGLLAATLTIIVGLPVAWLIVRASRPIRYATSSLALLPLVLPPTAVGYYLLYVLGRESAFGRFLRDSAGINLLFTWQGAAVAASVVALPLFVRTAQAGFEHIDQDYLDVARTMGHGRWSIFRSVELPMAWPSLVAAALIGFARGVGEFGAAVIVAGSIPGQTQTVPTAIYDAVQAGDRAMASQLALTFLAFSLVFIVGLTFVLDRRR